MNAQLTEIDSIRRYALAGRSCFTLVSKKTGARFTFRVHKAPVLVVNAAPSPRYVPHFVSVLTGPDNGSDYKFLGSIFADGSGYIHGRKSKISPSAPSAAAFEWFWRHLVCMNPNLFDQLEFWHAGKCGRCGRVLTTPESISSGLGPICAGI